ncbi:MAG: PQQ-binding-like beta-propeller repeat protein [Actinomycetota bacterium]|nr:PQQ-binding-like beta-propeller repeat protein [Actinomycetota bacterium]
MTGRQPGASQRRVLLVVIAAVLLGGVGATLARRSSAACGEPLITSHRADTPFFNGAQMRAHPDPRRDRLVRSVSRWSAPFGQVLGAVGFDYGQWLTLAGLDGGLGAWTRRNPDFAVLDQSTLAPRWGIRESEADQHAWDAGPGTYLGLTLGTHRPMQASSYDVRTGRRHWCTTIGSVPTRLGDPLATQVLNDGGLALLSNAPGGAQLSRLGAAEGHVRWQRRIAATEPGAALASLGHALLVVGGGPQSGLADPRAATGAAPRRGSVTAFAARDGKLAWTYQPPRGSAVHVVGTDPLRGLVVLMELHYGPTVTGRLAALDRSGRQVWSRVPPRHFYLDAAVRAGVVLLRSRTALTAYATGDGKALWHKAIPQRGQFFAYGFTLEQMSLLDENQLLVPTTSDLRILDLASGAWRRYSLPTDGVNTTFWPYQVVVTDKLIAVVTNTAAVVVRRQPVPG